MKRTFLVFARFQSDSVSKASGDRVVSLQTLSKPACARRDSTDKNRTSPLSTSTDVTSTNEGGEFNESNIGSQTHRQHTPTTTHKLISLASVENLDEDLAETPAFLRPPTRKPQRHTIKPAEPRSPTQADSEIDQLSRNTQGQFKRPGKQKFSIVQKPIDGIGNRQNISTTLHPQLHLDRRDTVTVNVPLYSPVSEQSTMYPSVKIVDSVPLARSSNLYDHIPISNPDGRCQGDAGLSDNGVRSCEGGGNDPPPGSSPPVDGLDDGDGERGEDNNRTCYPAPLSHKGLLMQSLLCASQLLGFFCIIAIRSVDRFPVAIARNVLCSIFTNLLT